MEKVTAQKVKSTGPNMTPWSSPQRPGPSILCTYFRNSDISTTRSLLRSASLINRSMAVRYRKSYQVLPWCSYVNSCKLKAPVLSKSRSRNHVTLAGSGSIALGLMLSDRLVGSFSALSASTSYGFEVIWGQFGTSAHDNTVEKEGNFSTEYLEIGVTQPYLNICSLWG